jgi:hypothetical protein
MRSRRRAYLCAAAAAAAAVAVAVAVSAVASVALADGDPASDFLLAQPTFVPFDANVSKARADELTAIVAEAKKRGYTIRVALIAKPFDLGAVPSLYGKPKTYARFLGQELFFLYKGRLLVVMPNGYGMSRRGKPLPSGQRVVDGLPKPGAGGDALALAATRAVRRLAAESGVRLEVPRSGGGRSATHDRIVLAAIAVGLALLFGAGLAARRLLVRR